MNVELERCISYINDNFRFGSKIKQNNIEVLFKKFSLSIEEKLTVYDELDELKIEVLGQPIDGVQKKVARLYFCIISESEVKKNLLKEWFAKENIDKKIQNDFYEKVSKEGVLLVEDETDLENKVEEQELDFLDSFTYNLDSLLEDDVFIKEVASYKGPVDKSRNIEYIIELNSDEESLKKEALSNIVEANKNLVWKIVSRYSGLKSVGLDEDDMYQVGMEGLMKAADKFDTSFDNTFSTYAVHWIRQAITRAIHDLSTSIRIPVHYREKMNKFKKIDYELWNKYARPATNLEIAKEMDITIDEANELKFYIEQIDLTSLDLYVGNEEKSALGEFVPDNESPTLESIIVEVDRVQVIKEMLESYLTDREREVLYYRFGFNSGEGMTLEEVGQIYNLTRERIRQIESRALKKLSNKKTSKILKEYLYEY